MKTGLFPPGFIRTAAAGTLLLLTLAGCDRPTARSDPPPPPDSPGPHNTIIVDTSAAGQPDYEGLPGEGPTLIILVPALDSQYRDPGDTTKYKPIEDTTIADMGSVQAFSPGPHNIVVIRRAAAPAGTAEGDLVKSPLVIVRTSQTDPSYLHRLKPGTRPVVVVNLPDNYPHPAHPGDPPILHTVPVPTPVPGS